MALNFSERAKRTTDLGRDPITTIVTEKPHEVVKAALQTISSEKKMLGESEDEIGWYHELLSQSNESLNELGGGTGLPAPRDKATTNEPPK